MFRSSQTIEVKGDNMSINLTLRNSIFQKTLVTLAALSLLQLAVSAQSSNELIVGQTALAGLARGELIRFTAFNPVLTDAGHPNEPISLKLRVFDALGNVIAESPEVTIPPGQFRWIDFDYDDLPITGEAGTLRKQFRTIPLWGLRSRSRLHVSTSLDALNSSTGAGTFKFFFTVEALP